ncbi:transcriptional regulator, AraC family with amidase-like domain [Actinoalloteichus cyanogriseus DSM 43889]|uniref:Transcriptional regulator, AraC family with amidase-like domain n=1 Tax=Actinoalloteichus caeruleus DSM 43889 TaxID=1120930 RepID=A0ABT1JL35_ACTCY|nr:transcriptional regulator, AraC family with amidase-like domain [Actinoalloteichus caeruleus DSM 43889]
MDGVDSDTRQRTILLVLYEGSVLLDTAGPLEVFDAASQVRPNSYRVSTASPAGGMVRTSSGVRLATDAALADIRTPPDTLLVVGSPRYREAARDTALVAEIGRLAAGARRVASVCTGAFVLAAAGLLDGRRAGTHWAHCEELAESHPTVRVVPDAIFVKDGNLTTSAGVTAGIDLALALVEDDQGPQVARMIARWMVVFLQRPGGQSQFSAWSRSRPVADPGLRRVTDHITTQPAADLSVPALAALVSVSPRHLSRLFLRETGSSPGRYVEASRVAAARALLEAGSDGLDRIANQTGFATTETMRRAFLRELGVPPGAYRARFHSTRGV